MSLLELILSPGFIRSSIIEMKHRIYLLFSTFLKNKRESGSIALNYLRKLP